MPSRRHIPAYVHHKPTGQARVRIDGQDYYLDRHGSAESWVKYDELIAELVIAKEPVKTTTLTAVLSAWWSECKRRYTKGKGRYGGAVNWRPVIRLLRESHGREPAEQLGPATLRRLIEAEAEKRDWSLRYSRDTLSRVKLIYKWAKNEELISSAAYERIRDCEIREGRKRKPIPPVSDKLVEKTIPLLTDKLADMVRLQRLAGMRPAEVVRMRVGEIDRSGDIWTYTPGSHKTEHHGKSRTIYLGPKAQAILAKWLLKARGEYVFPVRRVRPYSSDSYRRAIQRKCEQHGIEKWAPNQLRKAAATEIRSKLDVEHAASVLGHSSSVVTAQHYAEACRERAIEAARKLG